MNIILKMHNLQDSQPFIPRLMTPVVEEALRQFPVVILTGARQTGKSTLVQNLPSAGGRVYRTLDDFDVLDRAEREPETLVEERDRLTLDEVQRAPRLLLAIKRAVDKDRRRGRFLLTGSANLLLMRTVSESLAGRAAYLTLLPMTEAEKRGDPDCGPWSGLLQAQTAADLVRLVQGDTAGKPPWPEQALVGGFPVSVLSRSREERARWFDGYVRTYLERDLQSVASISALVDFRRLMTLAALRLGGVLNQSEIGRDAGLSQPTVHRYLNLLETSYQLVRLPAHARSRTTRLVKSPKVYWGDTGIGAFLAGISDAGELQHRAEGGALLENLVLVQILAWRETQVPRPEVYYWRTATGIEVDFVLESRLRLFPIEVKSTERARLDDCRGLEQFLDQHPKTAPVGLLLYGGAEVVRLTPRVVAAPIAMVL
jgi:predicted AAA+ superfamily ATPase